MDELRKKQIAEVLNEDLDINRRVFNQELRQVKAFGESLLQPSQIERRVAFEIDKYIIDIQNLLSQSLQLSREKDIEKNLSRVLENYNKLVSQLKYYTNIYTLPKRDIDSLLGRLKEIIPIIQDLKFYIESQGLELSSYYYQLLNDLEDRIATDNIYSQIKVNTLSKYQGPAVIGEVNLGQLKKQFNQADTKAVLLQKISRLRKQIADNQETINLVKQRGATEEEKKEDERAKNVARGKLARSEERLNTLQAKLDAEDYKEAINERVKRSEAIAGEEIRRKQARNLGVKTERPIAVAKPVELKEAEIEGFDKQIVDTFGTDTLNLYKAMPTLGLGQQRVLYKSLRDSQDRAQENDDDEAFNKSTFLLDRLTSLTKADDLEGKGRRRRTRVRAPMIEFEDENNEMFD
jgi:hypothetical protein